MKTAIIPLCLLIIILFSAELTGSEEEYVQWEHVKITSPLHRIAGRIGFEARTRGDEYRSIQMTAFGKAYDIPQRDLAKFRGFPLCSLVITQEAGYPELGGHTVHFKLKKSHYVSGMLLDDHIGISISRHKGLEIHASEGTQR